MSARDRQVTRLTVDPIGCQGHGVCAELLPEAITLDEWGYPVLAGGELPRELTRHARRAVNACPAAALRLQRNTAPPQTSPAVGTGSLQRGHS